MNSLHIILLNYIWFQMFFKNIREAMEIGKICMSKNTLFIIYLLIIHYDVHIFGIKCYINIKCRSRRCVQKCFHHVYFIKREPFILHICIN